MTAIGRPATEADAILGVRPETIYEPATIDEASALIAETSHSRRSLLFVGGATDLGVGSAPTRFDDLLSTRRLDRVLEHTPSDQIVMVEAGRTLASLQETLAKSGQRLAIDPPLPHRATIGGIVAANQFGPRRARFGSIRDLIIGVSLVRADGTLAKGGGKVVKNVAGFDLPKLMVGSLGTLGLIATVTLRLHPAPEEETTMLSTGRSSRQVRDLVGAMRQAQLEPTSVVAVWRKADRFDVAVRFEGFRAGVEQQRQRLESMGGQGAAAFATLDAPASKAFWAHHDELRSAPPVRAKIAALPTHLERITATALPELTGAFVDPGFVWYATLGLGFFSGAPGDVESCGAALAAARASLEIAGGHLTLLSAPCAIRDQVGVWGASPGALPLMASVKDRLDPDHRLAPGRFVGGI